MIDFGWPKWKAREAYFIATTSSYNTIIAVTQIRISLDYRMSHNEYIRLPMHQSEPETPQVTYKYWRERMVLVRIGF